MFLWPKKESLSRNDKIDITRLDLSDNPIEDKGLVSLSALCLKHEEFSPKLSYLSLSNCNFGPQGIKVFSFEPTTNTYRNHRSR